MFGRPKTDYHLSYEIARKPTRIFFLSQSLAIVTRYDYFLTKLRANDFLIKTIVMTTELSSQGLNIAIKKEFIFVENVLRLASALGPQGIQASTINHHKAIRIAKKLILENHYRD